MTLSVVHAFASAKGDGADATFVQPSNWNAEHTFTVAADVMLGRVTSGAGAVEEISVTAYGRDTLLSLANAAALTGEITVASLSGTTANFNTALSDGSFCTIAGAETLTNKTINGGTLGATTLAGAVTGAAQIVSDVEVQDIAETVQVLGSISGANNLPFTAGGFATMTITGSTTLTMTAPPATGKCGSMTLEITNGGANVTIAAGTQADSGGTTLALTTSGVDVVTIYTIDAATTVRVFISGLDMG